MDARKDGKKEGKKLRKVENVKVKVKVKVENVIAQRHFTECERHHTEAKVEVALGRRSQEAILSRFLSL